MNDKLQFINIHLYLKSLFFKIQMNTNYEDETILDLTAINKLKIKDYNSQNIEFEKFTKLTTLILPYHSLYNEKLIKLTNLTELHITPDLGTNFEALELREKRGIFGLRNLTNLKKLTIENNYYFQDFDIFDKKLELLIIKNNNNFNVCKLCGK